MPEEAAWVPPCLRGKSSLPPACRFSPARLRQAVLSFSGLTAYCKRIPHETRAAVSSSPPSRVGQSTSLGVPWRDDWLALGASAQLVALRGSRGLPRRDASLAPN